MKTIVRTAYTTEETMQFESDRLARKLAARITAEKLRGRGVTSARDARIAMRDPARDKAMHVLREGKRPVLVDGVVVAMRGISWTPAHTGLAAHVRFVAAEAQRLASRKASKRRAARVRKHVAGLRGRSERVAA